MKKMNAKMAMILAILTFGIANNTNAQSQRDRKPMGPPTFAQLLTEMDVNEDGKLAQSEIKGPLKEDFLKVDTNKDGFICEEEFNKAPKPKGRKENN